MVVALKRNLYESTEAQQQMFLVQELRKFGDVTLDVGVIHELPLLLMAVMRKSCGCWDEHFYKDCAEAQQRATTGNNAIILII